MYMNQVQNATDRIVLGQFFDDNGRTITAQTCWMLLYLDNSCEGHCAYITPLLPSKISRSEFYQKYRFDANCAIYDDFLDRQNGTFETPETEVETFLDKLPDFGADEKFTDSLEKIRTCLTDQRLWVADDYGEPFPRHLYLAKIPKQRLTFVEFDDDAYRPEVRLAIAENGAVYYNDFLGTARNWPLLNPNDVEELFCDIPDAAINALNDGLSGLNHFEQQALPSQTATEQAQYQIMNHIYEIQVVPTIWRTLTGIHLQYDLLANWQTGRDGAIRASLGEFAFSHKPNTLHGKITRVRAKKVLKEKAVTE